MLKKVIATKTTKTHSVLQSASMVGWWGCSCLLQSATESGSGTPLVSGSSRHSPQHMIGPLLQITIAAKEIAPSGFAGTRVLTRQPSRKDRLTSDKQRCLDLKTKKYILLLNNGYRRFLLCCLIALTSQHLISDEKQLKNQQDQLNLQDFNISQKIIHKQIVQLSIGSKKQMLWKYMLNESKPTLQLLLSS